MERLHSLMGFAALALVAWVLSENRRRVNPRTIVAGLLLQVALGAALLKFEPFRGLFRALNEVVLALGDATTAGTTMVFGFLGGGPLPFEEMIPGGSYVFAFRGLVLILVVSALTSLLFYWRVLPLTVRALSWMLRKTLGLGGCEALGGAANIFVGMVESPILIGPYLKNFSRSEMFAVMTTGMATIAGTVMILYAQVLGGADTLGHILVASIISAPAAFTVAKIMIPQTDEPVTGQIALEQEASGSMDAIVQGTTRGLHLLLNVVAMLIVCVALVRLVNIGLGFLPGVADQPLTLERLLGWFMAPVAWLIGIPWAEAKTAGTLLGIKTVLNEFLAYMELAKLDGAALSERSRLILTYALCGFANFGSLGIMIGGMGALAPEKRAMIIGLGMKSIVAGTIATCMTGAVVGFVM